ncbi:hypothetical protein GCM10010507_08320 [Streptomyces cinnamoneus]|uniref:Pirin family protein n=1 Tax=Streptomyces cinnamoneus TaxID=53446 RepID=A0A918T9Z1_STRCJ|nr:hypothetical protein GCM10010507_08320 [Streptomyces cinnamoneus]
MLHVGTAPGGFEGEGFPVRRAFAGIPYQLIDGTFVHRDSHGGGGVITDGDTQWMTAGSGLLHIEAPPEALVVSGGLFHGLQLWVNLPKKDKMMPPRYQDIGSGKVALLTSSDGGALLRLIAGSVDGHEGPGITHTPITMLHVSLNPGAELTLPWRADFNGLAYALAGRGTAGAEHRPFRTGQTVVFGSGDALTLKADASQESRSPNFEVVLLGGRPIREPMKHYGPFVMNTHAELAQAFEDFQAGRLGTVPADAA